MSKPYLARVFELDKFLDSSGFERTNTRLIKHRTFSTLEAAYMYKIEIERHPNKRVVIRKNK
ncbi:hypothetical protein C6P11_02515 [Weissella confusa]|uniref:Uncharacterized protein n=1 Tax=Weissella confusa TaxID=1583 RepID=A0A4Z0S1J9_WEICO|nr:hypothetical protein C6P11_02515 [Weissella confusa]